MGGVFPLVKALAGLRKHKRLDRIKNRQIYCKRNLEMQLKAVFQRHVCTSGESICCSGKQENTCFLPRFKAKQSPDPTGCSIEPESPKSLKTQTPYQGILSLEGTLGYINT